MSKYTPYNPTINFWIAVIFPLILTPFLFFAVIAIFSTLFDNVFVTWYISFLFFPFCKGLISAWLYNRQSQEELPASFSVSCLPLLPFLLITLASIYFAIFIPILILVNFIGVALGRVIAEELDNYFYKLDSENKS